MPVKLMIVDDSNIIRSKITRTLSQHEIEIVAAASDGEEAIRLFAATRPDVVTMDLTMPRMDGLECIRALRKLKSNVRILVVSALADKATAIQALKEGAQGFLCKPFTETELTDAMEELLGGA
ncbi:two-component system, chemotaxis family, response regulator CheY [Formivibrio citricus]|uniref:Two-component system, chemotaxis family, response regulator CheY n=1 Tax=Formivibrio citricus TaxID=83765 RepID=A0A1I5CNN3_9NEIS|nr:response regulator [Formivibrio citricus]SFN88635.1 two-component system, chemotaxis family, response regulator CheY [Formivibrio citricus]